MRWSDISFTDRTIRQFAALCLPCFGGLALWQWLYHGNFIAAMGLAAIAATITPLGLLQPAWIRPIYRGWMVLVFPLGWVVSQLVLAVLYFGLFTPVALWFKIIGRDALRRKLCPEQDSYWQERTAPELSRYFRQY